LVKFPTPHPESIASLMNQLTDFVRPSGKKPISALPPGMEPASPGGSGTGTPFSPREPGEGGSDEERPKKRRRNGPGGGIEHSVQPNGSGNGHGDGINESEVGDDETGGGDEGEGRQGKKPGGKTAGKGTMPRTVVRGVRGLVAMETDAEGNQHVGGHLPDSALTGNREKQVQDGAAGGDGAEGEEEDEADVPLAQRPQLDLKEKRRRELQKEKEREREAEVVQRLTQGVSVEDGPRTSGEQGEAVDVEQWEGVDLVSLLCRLYPGHARMVEAESSLSYSQNYLCDPPLSNNRIEKSSCPSYLLGTLHPLRLYS
jgi:histone acetyltransferase